MSDTDLTSPLTPVDLVSQGQAVLKIENEVMLQVAVQRPRDESKILRGALDELDLVPEEAGKAYYSIPFRETQPDGTTRMVKVEGLSINAAMAMARRWGNCSVTARFLHEDDHGWDLEGVMIDLETNFRIARPFRVSKFQRRRGSKDVILLAPDRQVIAIQAGASKAIRNAILAALPAYLKGAYERKARELVGGHGEFKADKKTVDAVLKAFRKLGVSQQRLEVYAEEPIAEWTGSIVADLRGIWNAIKDGQTTVEDAFPAEAATGRDDGQVGQASGVRTLTPASLFGGQVTAENDAPKPGDKP